MAIAFRLTHLVWLTLFVSACGSSAANDKKTTTTVNVSASTGTAKEPALPPPTEVDMSEWVGKYKFEEGTTGFAWTYITRIEKEPEGYLAHFSLEGFQVSMHFICKLRSVGPDKIDLLYLREDKDNLSTPYDVDTHLFSLERTTGGKVEYRWAEIKPNIEPRKEGPAEIGDPHTYVKKYPEDFLRVKAVMARLEKRLGATEYKRLDEFIATQDPIKESGDFLIMDGFLPHSGGSQKAMVIYDMKRDTLHALLLDEDKKTLDVYSEKSWKDLPQEVEEKIRDWNAPYLKLTRHQ